MSQLYHRRTILGSLAPALGTMALSRAIAAEDGGRTVEATLEARAEVVTIGDEAVRVLSYNGLFPGPQIRAAEGDLLRVTLANAMEEPTNLHFHGLHVSPAGKGDNVFVTVPPNGRHTYEFTVPRGYGGTFWYHPHRHGHFARQLWHGLAGALVIDRPEDMLPELAAADEQVVVIKDLTIEETRPAAHRAGDWARGKSGGMVLVNGMLRPIFEARAMLVRLRLVNASNARMLLLARGDGRLFHLIAYDGHLLDAPRQLDQVLVTPAQRVDLLLTLEQGVTLNLVHKPYNRGAAREPSVIEPLFAIRAAAGLSPGTPPRQLSPVEQLDATAVTRVRRFRMAMAFLAPDGHAHMTPVRARLGGLELWDITNVDTQDHVFHLHTWPFQIWRQNGRELPYRAWRDTVNLRPGDRLELLVPFRRYTGKSVFHCHIAEHGDAGMMGIVEVEA
jgi:FtsP/CotA-like multicopper oxidase with cupredoxin domain